MYAKAAKVPMVEPADSRECKEYVKAAFEISENLILRLFSDFRLGYPIHRVLLKSVKERMYRLRNTKRIRKICHDACNGA